MEKHTLLVLIVPTHLLKTPSFRYKVVAFKMKCEFTGSKASVSNPGPPQLIGARSPLKDASEGHEDEGQGQRVEEVSG